MIVVAIIGVLAAIGIVNFGNSTRKSKEAVTKGESGIDAFGAFDLLQRQ